MLLLLLVLEAIPLVQSQVTHTVSVGVKGSVYDPPTLTAGTNDTVNFLFLGDVHSIIQSSAKAPCLPLLNGFSSSLFGRGVNLTGPTVMWSLKVTNASTPIWYFCAATTSVSHCKEGMVGAINPPSQDAYDLFQRAAKAYNYPPVWTPSLVLQGVGAIATFPVTLTDTTLLTPAPTSVPSASTTASSATNTGIPTSPSHKHGPIVGGAVSGALGVVSITVILFCYCIKRRRRRWRQTVSRASYFAYNPHPHPLDTEQLETTLSSTGSMRSSPQNSDSTITNNWMWEGEVGFPEPHDFNRGQGVESNQWATVRR